MGLAETSASIAATDTRPNKVMEKSQIFIPLAVNSSSKIKIRLPRAIMVLNCCTDARTLRFASRQRADKGTMASVAQAKEWRMNDV